MVPLPSDTITLPLLPRTISWVSSPMTIASRKVLRQKKKSKSLSSKQMIIIAVVSAVVVLAIILTLVIWTWQRKRRAARMAPPKDAMASHYSSASSFGGFPGAPPEQALGGPRPLDNHLSPGESQLHDVPLSAGPRYGYGAQVDGLRIPGMAAQPPQYGYSQAPMSHFSPA